MSTAALATASLLLVRFHGDVPGFLHASGIELFRAVEGTEGHAYVSDERTQGEVERFAADVSGVSWSRLSPLCDVFGASHGAPAPFHYVVATDVLPEHERDFNAWYETEHLPGLAGVPGTVRARRYRALQGAPRYHACYDLVAPQTLGSPPWLAVRGTPWSARVRPHFRNTYRTMFRRVTP